MGYTAKVAVWLAKGTCHAVVVDNGCVKALVCSHDVGRQPPAQSKSSSISKGTWSKHLYMSVPPPVRGLSWSLANSMTRAVSNHASSAPLGAKIWQGPSADPWCQVFKSDGHVQTINLAEDAKLPVIKGVERVPSLGQKCKAAHSALLWPWASSLDGIHHVGQALASIR